MQGPVYILGSERSGTNFLRKSLSEVQSQLCCTIPPAHFLRTFGYWAYAFGDLQDATSWREIVTFFRRSTIERAVPWDVDIGVEQVLQRYAEQFGGTRDLIRLGHVFYTCYAEAKGFQSYLCKDIELQDFAAEIAVALPSARFIHIVRDPRDVCASQKQRPFGQGNVRWLIGDWTQQCTKAMRFACQPEWANRVHRVRYEDLIGSHKGRVKVLLAALDIPRARPERVEAFQTNFHEWKNLSQPVLINNAGKYADVLSHFEITVIEAISWNNMRTLQYIPQHLERPSIGSMRLIGYETAANIKTRMRRRWKKWQLRHEPINRRASERLVADLEATIR